MSVSNGLVVFMFTRNQVVQGEAIVASDKVHTLLRLRFLVTVYARHSLGGRPGCSATAEERGL
jgi:hypothetical protein